MAKCTCPKCDCDWPICRKERAERSEIVEAAKMARTRLEDFADKANAGTVHYSARELKRKIWAAFVEFDELVKR